MRFLHHIITGRSVPCDTIADGTEKDVVSLGRLRLVVTAGILAIYQTPDVIFEYAGGPGGVFFSDFPSPLQRLPLGIYTENNEFYKQTAPFSSFFFDT